MKSNEKIGPYRLIEPLGSGGMGTVWRARDERLKRSVALKRILPTPTKDPKLRERLRREAEAGALLNHPAIVHIYDIVETEESDWIVMELVDGRTIQELLREGPLDPQHAIRLGREIAEGLTEAHAQGFIHRDLKALNVMVTRAGRAKILDFGVAKQVQPETQETTLSTPGFVVGTSYAMSPEQAMGLPLDARSDLFALGSLLYEMVTGVAPFRAETATATLARVCSFRQRPASVLRPEIPQELSDLIDRLLEKEPADRPRSAEEVASALNQIAAAQTPSAAGAQVSRGEVDTSDQETLLETPRAVPSVAVEAAPPPDRALGQENAISSARNLRIATGIALLLVLAIAGYLLSRQVVQSSAQDLYQQGMTYLDRHDRKGNLDSAIDSFQKVLAQDENHAAAHAGLAKAYWIRFHTDSRDRMWLDRALPMADRAVALDPYLAAAQVSLGMALGSAGRHEEALRHIERALVLEPRNSDAFYVSGRIYESQGKLSKAEEAYKRAAKVRPHGIYFGELGSLYLRMGRTEEAITVFRRSIELSPDSYIGYRNLGVAYYMQGDLAEAASQFQKSLQIQPDATIYANLGTVHFSQGLYQHACRWTPDKKERSRDAYRTAIQLLEEQLHSTPGDQALRSRLALYLAKRGDLAKALTELRGLEKLPDKDASTWFRIAVAFEVCAHRKNALAALERALRAGLPVDEVRKDPELLDLRADAQYHSLVGELSKEQ